MPRSFPSQIAEYLSLKFDHPQAFSIAMIESEIGSVAGFLELYDQIPYELIRLPSREYADLVAAIGTIRFRLAQFRNGTHPNCLGAVGTALARAREHIEKLEDLAPSTEHDLSFIKDDDFRDMIAKDVSAIEIDLQSGEWKSATLLAGSCCEALLLYALQACETKSAGAIALAVSAIWPSGKRPDPNDLLARSWDFAAYAKVAHHLKLISDNTKGEIEPAREYRNLIHPAKGQRERAKFDRGTARVGAGAVEHVIADLKAHL